MNEEHFSVACTHTFKHREVVTGKYRTCELVVGLLKEFLPEEQERICSAIEVFADLHELSALPMHRSQPQISLRGEQSTKIDGVEIYFLKNGRPEFVIFSVSIDEPEDDGGDQEARVLIYSWCADSQTAQREIGQAVGQADRFSTWGDAVHGSAIAWVQILMDILLASGAGLFLLQRPASACLEKFTGIVRDDEWQIKILSNDLHCRDFRDLFVGLQPIILERPQVWLEDRSESMFSFDSFSRSELINLVVPTAVSSRLQDNEQVVAELTITQAPGGIWMIGLELACKIDAGYLSAYVQLAAPHHRNHDTGAESQPSIVSTAGRLRVLLRR